MQADPEKRLAAALKDEQLSKLVSDGTFDTSLPEARLFLIEIGTAKQLIDAVSLILIKEENLMKFNGFKNFA